MSKSKQSVAVETAEQNEPADLQEIAAGSFVQVKDTEAGFTDMITGFDLSRDQVKELTDPIGDSTRSAIMSGRLLVVPKPKKTAAKDGE